MLHICTVCENEFNSVQPKTKTCSKTCKLISVREYYRNKALDERRAKKPPKYIPDYKNERLVLVKKK